MRETIETKVTAYGTLLAKYPIQVGSKATIEAGNEEHLYKYNNEYYVIHYSCLEHEIWDIQKQPKEFIDELIKSVKE